MSGCPRCHAQAMYYCAYGGEQGCCMGLSEAAPDKPVGEANVWYRGWEVGFDSMAADWSPNGWRAYKGGCDLGAPSVEAETYRECLEAVDEEEDDT